MNGRALLLLACVLAALAARAPAAQGATTSPLDVAVGMFPAANLTGWQLCAASLAAAPGTFPLTQLDARCSGPNRMLACVQLGVPDTLVLGAGSLVANVNGNTTASGIAWFSDPVVGRAGWANQTAAPANCLAAGGDGVCRNVQDGAWAPGMYCGTAIGYSLSTVVSLLVFSDPCNGLGTGAACTDSFGLCATGNTCQANGTCAGGTPVPSPPPDPCVQTYTCDPTTGNYTAIYQPFGTVCTSSPPDLCAVVQTCDNNHQCVTNATNACPSIDPCKLAGVCNATSGGCIYPFNATDGTTCSDANACTFPDASVSGACVPGPLVVAANLTCANATSCDPVTGAWNYTALPLGSSCVPQSPCVDLITLGANFQCAAGLNCTATTTTNCSALPRPLCRTPGFCSAQQSICTTDVLPIGTTCDDGNPCTQGTYCTNGTCGNGGPSLGCAAPSDPCLRAVLVAINASVCDCGTGPAPDNTSCTTPYI
jgi:hypothetical protein